MPFSCLYYTMVMFDKWIPQLIVYCTWIVYHEALRFITNSKSLTHHCVSYTCVDWLSLYDCRYIHWCVLICMCIFGLLPSHLKTCISSKNTNSDHLQSPITELSSIVWGQSQNRNGENNRHVFGSIHLQWTYKNLKLGHAGCFETIAYWFGEKHLFHNALSCDCNVVLFVFFFKSMFKYFGIVLKCFICVAAVLARTLISRGFSKIVVKNNKNKWDILKPITIFKLQSTIQQSISPICHGAQLAY